MRKSTPLRLAKRRTSTGIRTDDSDREDPEVLVDTQELLCQTVEIDVNTLRG